MSNSARQGWPEPAALAQATLFFAFFYGVYGISAVAADGLSVRYHLYFAWEPDLPLWPWTALIYMSLNLMVIPLLWTFPTPARLRPLLLTLAFELMVATVIFFVVPLEDGFRDPPLSGGGAEVLNLAKSLALRHNYFPSLHVALAFTGAAALSRQHPSRTALFYAWAGLVALSTLTTHSHHIADVVAGMALAWLGYGLIYRPRETSA